MHTYTIGGVDIFTAARTGNVHEVQQFIAAGVSVNEKNHNRDTPLHLAAKNGHAKVVKLLLEHGANIEASNKSLLLAAKNGHTKVVEHLLENGVDTEVKDRSLLFAANNNHDKVVEALLAHGANIEVKDNHKQTPLLFAAQNGHIEVVKILLANGANIEAKDNNKQTPLLFAAKNGHIEVVKILLTNGANIQANNKHGDTSLHLSAENGHSWIVKLLLQFNDIDVNKKNNNGNTPLHLAAKNGHTWIVKFVLKNGADFNIKDGSGYLPLPQIRYLLENDTALTTAVSIYIGLVITFFSGTVLSCTKESTGLSWPQTGGIVAGITLLSVFSSLATYCICTHNNNKLLKPKTEVEISSIQQHENEQEFLLQ